MKCDEAKELITALVDQELRDPERNALEVHLTECASCRSALENEQALKQAIRRDGQGILAPDSLRDRILSNPSIFPEKGRSARSWRDYILPTAPMLRAALAIVFLLALVLPMFYFFRPAGEPIAFAALQTYDLFLRGKLPLHRVGNAKEIEVQLSGAVGGRFHPMGYDLSTMNLRPVAALVQEIQGRKILVAIYEGQGGSLFCYTFLGSEKDVPPNAAKFFDADKKMNLYAFSRDGMNGVFHREGEVICILVSAMPMKELLALAQAKAKPS